MDQAFIHQPRTPGLHFPVFFQIDLPFRSLLHWHRNFQHDADPPVLYFAATALLRPGQSTDCTSVGKPDLFGDLHPDTQCGHRMADREYRKGFFIDRSSFTVPAVRSPAGVTVAFMAAERQLLSYPL